MPEKLPDLDFNKDWYGIASDGIELFIDNDCLKIKGYNIDSDNFHLKLDPTEIRKLIDFLVMNFG